jgi:hypothetical protein
MIKVTIGESKPQEKSFPKLMIGDQETILIALCRPYSSGYCPVFIPQENQFSMEYRLIGGAETFTDYNEPITIQNA